MLKVYRMRNNRTLGIWLSLFALLICMLIWTIEQFEYSREIDFKHFKWPSYIDVKSQVEKELKGLPPRPSQRNKWSDFESLVQPECRIRETGKHSLLVIVKTAPDRVARRHAYRKTISKLHKLEEYSIEVVFVMGYEAEKLFNGSMLHVESIISKDMLVGRFVDGYYNNTYKYMHSLKLSRWHCSSNGSMAFSFVLLLDDDFLVRLDNLVSLIRRYSPDEPFYFGHGWKNAHVFRSWKDKFRSGGDNLDDRLDGLGSKTAFIGTLNCGHEENFFNDEYRSQFFSFDSMLNPPSVVPIVKPVTSVLHEVPTTTSTTSTQSPPPNILFHHHSPIPKKFESNFPAFPSFDDGHLNAPSRIMPPAKIEETDSCKAVKCSFLDTSCQWTLGKNWKLGQGNVAIESTAEDYIRSGYFKAPLASFLEFDLWMSDDANIFIAQETQEVGMPGTDELSLFSRKGMANNGWHRFRVPLRPSFNSIRLKIRARLQSQNAFVTLSNTRLVNANGEEANCEITSGVFVAPLEMNNVPLMNGVVQTGGLTTMSDSLSVTTMAPFLAGISPLATGTPPLTGNPFSFPVVTPPSIPLEFMRNLDAGVQAFQQQQQSPQTMLMDGVTPIVPMRDSLTQRLTAFQKLPQQLEFPTLAPFPSLFDSPPFGHQSQQPFPFIGQQLALTRPPATSTTEYPPPDPFSDTDLIATPAKEEMNESDAFDEDNQLSSSSTRKDHFTTGRDTGRIIGDVTSQPSAEQKLRQLAQQLGMDFDRLVSGKQLSVFRRVLAGQMPPNLPLSVGQTTNENDSGVKPIKPSNVNEEDFERVLQQETQKRLIGQAVNSDMLKKLAKILNLIPSSPTDRDRDSPMARENVDFVFQNAMMQG